MNIADLIQTPRDLEEVIEIAVNKALAKAGKAPLECSQNEAWRRYGRMTVEVWKERGQLKPIKRGSGKNCKVYYLISELETADFIERKAKYN